MKKYNLEILGNVAKIIRKKGKKIGLCHGVFDVLHAGHISHFEEVKKKCDYLFVTITEDKFVNKGPNRPVNNHYFRAKVLESLKIVDYVAINFSPDATKSIKQIKPDFYFKDLLDAKDSGKWQSLYPAQLSSDIKNMQHVDLKKFFTLYTQYFWNEEEYLSRYVNQNMFLHYFLEQHNVSHIFYNAFYDSLHHIGPEESFNARKGDLTKRHILNGLTDVNNSWGSQTPPMNKAVEEFFRIAFL